jgi:hypothetical protein
VVEVTIITTSARDMPTGPAIHAWCMTTRVVMPTRPDRNCPPMKLRGCAILDSITPKMSTAEEDK